MPTTNFKGIQKMSKQCSTSIPKWLENKYSGLEDRLDERKKVSKEVAIDFCQKLISNDFRAIHFYTFCLLYTSPSPRDISGSRMPSSA